MRHYNDSLRLLPLLAVSISLLHGATTPLRFEGRPLVERFPDGALEWNAVIPCSDPLALSGARITFALDFDLDGSAENKDSVVLSSADCENEEAHPRKTLFPSNPGIMTARLRQGSTVSDSQTTFVGSIGSVLSMRRFCARPSNGEPEWIEIRNASSLPVTLTKVRVEGHVLHGALDPGAAVVVGKDSGEISEWQPGAEIMSTTSWSYLRNSGDTLRVNWDNKVVLDSLIYGAAAEPHEACASSGSDENAASASGYALELSSKHWHYSAEPLEISVQAPSTGAYDLLLYDLDGFEICAPLRNNIGPVKFQVSVNDCPMLLRRSGSMLLQLKPKSSTPVRKLLRVDR